MANCANLCTAEKCQELERRIGVLESTLALLEASFESHISQDIPQAHDFRPSWKVDVDHRENTLFVTVTMEGDSRFDSVVLDYVTKSEFNDHLNTAIPFAHDYQFEYQPTVGVDIVEGELIVSVDDMSDRALLPEMETDVLVDVFPTEDNTAVIKVMVNGESDESLIQFPEVNFDDLNIQNELKFESLSGSDSKLTSTVTVNEQSATDFVYLDVNTDVSLSGNKTASGFNLTVRVDEGEDSIFIPDRVGGGGGEGGGGDPIDTSDFATKNEVAAVDGKIDAHMETSLSDSHPNDLDLQVTLRDAGNGVLRACVQIPGLASNCGEIDLFELLDMEEILKLTKRIYKILGGDLWGDPDSEVVTLKVKPEEYIRNMGIAQYQTDVSEGEELTISSLVQLLGALTSVDYFRSGHHRLPATLLTSLINTEEGNQPLTIYDQLSFQEWIIRNIDAIAGEYPLEINSKTTDDSGNEVEQTITFNNNAEALAEITALIIGMVQDTDDTLNASLRTLAEARAAANAAIVAVDYAAANAEYLGYKGKEKIKEVPMCFTPKAESLRATLQPSTQKIVSWENQDKETLVELVKRTLIGAEIVRAANYIPWKPGQNFTGDTIRESKEAQRTENEQKWEQFINETNNPTGRLRVDRPPARIKDITIDNPGS